MKMLQKHFLHLHYKITLLCLVACYGCKKLIEVDLPIDKYTSETIFSEIPTAVAASNSIYAIMANNPPYTGEYGLSIRCGLMADELATTYAQTDLEYRNNNIGFEGWSFWPGSYKDAIYRINSVLEGVSNSKSLPERAKRILTGESKFCRAWIYFYLVNLYGDVPLVLNTNFVNNSNISRSPNGEIYKQIIRDLLDAQELLTVNFIDKDLLTPTVERIRPNKGAATALLAKVYLYQQRWREAEIEATKVIENDIYKLSSDLDEVFIKNSGEAIWQLQPNPLNGDGKNTPDGRYLINPFGGAAAYFASPQLLSAFETEDKRLRHWIDTSLDGRLIVYKYKQGWATDEQTEYTMALRVADQYLIRAEARAQQDLLTGPNSAEADLNIIRNRAGLLNTQARQKNDLLDAIVHERQVELFLEYGNRWFDLKRWGKIDQIMSVVTLQKGTNWMPYKSLMPIPYDEFKYNLNLRGTQNPGYREQP